MGIMERLLILEINSVTIVLFWNLLGTGRLSSLITVVVIQSGVKKTVHILELARIQKKTGTTAHVMLLWGGSVRNCLSTELYVYMLLKGIVPVPSHQEYLLKRFIKKVYLKCSEYLKPVMPWLLDTVCIYVDLNGRRAVQ